MSCPTRAAANIRAPSAQIDRRSQALVARGAREIVLLGQNVNAYRGAGPDGAAWSLARLIEATGGDRGSGRIRYTTSHPRDMGDDLIAAHGDIDKLMPYLHLPVQSGSDAVLAAMNRQHTADDYLQTHRHASAHARPDIALSSDFIVGFPGESDADFEATLALVRDIGFAQSYSFKYSKRPGTPAAAARKQIAEDVKNARLQALQNLLLEQQETLRRVAIGRTMDSAVRKAAAAGWSGHRPHALSAACPC